MANLSETFKDAIYCDCACHNPDGIKPVHVMACCYTCPYCKARIKQFFYEGHIQKCSQDFAHQEHGIVGVPI